MNYDIHRILKKWSLRQFSFPVWGEHRKTVDIYVRRDTEFSNPTASRIPFIAITQAIKDIEVKLNFQASFFEAWGSYIKVSFRTNNQVIQWGFKSD
jgi:hypothetical protein